MATKIDAATEAFLEAARDDLQRQLASTAHVDDMAAEVNPHGTVVRAWVSVADEVLTLEGSGETLVEAYGDLIRGAWPSLVLASAYRQVLEQRLP